MKYLKRFNESNDYYKNVDYNEWSDVLSKHIQFEQKYIDILKSRLKNKYTIINSYEDILIDGGRWDRYVMTQCNDEWFFIKHEVQDIMSGPYNESYVYYKCDQFDGLLKFLKDYNIIN